MQDGRQAVWSIPYVSVAFFPSLKQNFIAYHSSKVSDCIFEIHQLWQSGFSRVYSSCCCSCSFEPEIIKIGQSSHKMYRNNILNFQESTRILNAHTKKCLETYIYMRCIRYFISMDAYLRPLGFMPSLHANYQTQWLLNNTHTHKSGKKVYMSYLLLTFLLMRLKHCNTDGRNDCKEDYVEK